MVQFLSIFFFFLISSIFVGFFKRSRFFVSLCINELGFHPCGMKRKVWEDRLNLRRPTVRPERWVLVDSCFNLLLFYRSQYRHIYCCKFLSYVTISPFVMIRSVPMLYYVCFSFIWGTAVAQWLRCCATNRKVAGSIPDGVIGIFH